MHQLIIIFLLITSPLVFADNNYSESAEKLTLEQAIINVLESSPMLKAADYEAKAAAARIRTAIQSPLYQGTIEFENFGGSGNRSDVETLETTLSLSKVLELGDKAKYRGELSQDKAMLLRNEQDSNRLDLLAEATKRYIGVIADQQRFSIAIESIDTARHNKQIIEKRVKAGKSPNAELRSANISLARSELTLEHAKHTLETTRLKLATLWGETQTSFSAVDASFMDIKQNKPFESLVLLLANNPDLIRFATETRLAKSRTLLEKSSANSNIEVTGGLRHFKVTDDTALVFSLNIPFGSSAQATSAINEAEMLALREPHIYEQQRLALYATLFEFHHEITHAVSAITTLQETIIPHAKKALEDYEKGYAAGRYSFSELTEAQQLLLDLKREMVITVSDYHRYHIEIDRLTGAGLSSGVTQ